MVADRCGRLTRADEHLIIGMVLALKLPPSLDATVSI
jgi:hypothetical protein